MVVYHYKLLRVLSDILHNTNHESNEIACAKWDYSVKLCLWQYHEGILDQRHFLKWSIIHLGSSSFDWV